LLLFYRQEIVYCIWISMPHMTQAKTRWDRGICHGIKWVHVKEIPTVHSILCENIRTYYYCFKNEKTNSSSPSSAS
jgi:hypothetical protein